MEPSSGVRLYDGSVVYADPDSINYTLHGLDYSRKPDKLQKGVQKLEEHAQAIERMHAVVFKITGYIGPAIAEAAISLRTLKDTIIVVVFLDTGTDPEERDALASKLLKDKSAGVAIQKPCNVFQKALDAYRTIQASIKAALEKGWKDTDVVLIQPIGKEGRSSLAFESQKFKKPEGMSEEIYREWLAIYKRIPMRIEEMLEFMSRAAVQRSLGITEARPEEEKE